MDADLKERLSGLVKAAERHVPYAAALYKRRSGTRVTVNRMQENVEPEDPAEGLVFTLWNGQRFFEYAVNRWEWPALEERLAAFAKQAAAERDSSRSTSDLDPGPELERDFASPVGRDPRAMPAPEKLALARGRVREAAAIDPMVANAIAVVGDVESVDIFVNRRKRLSQRIVRSDAILVVYVTDGTNMSDLHTGLSKNGGYDAVPITTDEIRNLVDDGKRLVSASRLTPGTYDIVTDPEWSGIIAHECFGHGMETDLYVRQRAMSQRYIGKPVASTLVNMYDDPSAVAEAGGFFFDDEGQLATRTVVIKDGVLQRGLTDLASAHALGLARSANGRRESYARKAYARMTNTFFGGGTSNRDAMIASIERGLYLKHATNGMEDPQAWGIQVEGLWAEEIAQGRLTGKVYSPVIMTGYVPDLLMSISMVGDDPHISGLGMCGKGHKEWVKNTTGGPHLKMRARLA